MSLPKLLVILGPTASGKTGLAISLARKFNGEVVSADSRQFYRGLEVGAAVPEGKWGKILPAGRQSDGRKTFVVGGVAHHLMAFRSPAKPLTAAEFKTLAGRKIKEIIRRGRLPILCGGTGLYISAVADNLDVPKAVPNPALRARLYRQAASRLYARLEELDPEYAARISPANKRYMVRALEVIAATGSKFSELQGRGEPRYDVLKIGLAAPRERLYRRINARVDAMMGSGLLNEARRAGRRYGWDARPLSALGHRQLGLYLCGEIGLDEAIRLIKRDTRHYAKRQMTWFRRDKTIKWVRQPRSAERLVKSFISGLKTAK